jgi:hypothetical protein
MDLLKQAQKIVKEKNHNMTQHLWLEGFDKIINEANLNESLVNIYLELRLKEYKEFTPLISSNFLYSKKTSIENFTLRVVHYPIDDDYHLLFGLEKNNCVENFVYTECSEYCRILKPFRFPYIELRRSVNFDKNQEAMSSIKKGKFLYDNRVPIIHQTPDQIIEYYKIMKEFIERVRIN